MAGDNPHIRKQLESNRQTRDGWTRFAEHRERVHSLLDTAAPSAAATLCVLGAGNCNDLDLKRLCRTFTEIHLVDLDADAVRAALSRQGVARFPGIRIHAPCDLTGVIDQVPPPGAIAQGTKVERLLERLRRHSLPFAAERFDVVLSAAVLTQMFQTVEDIGFESESTLRLLLQLRRQHLRLLLELTRSGGAVVLVVDVVSTASAPELTALRSEQLGRRLAHLIEQRNFFTGTNPVQLQAALTQDPDIAPLVDQVAFHEPWLWRLTTKHQYLTYAVTFRKRSRQRPVP